MMKIPGIRGLLLLFLCIAVVSCGKKTADPNVTLGDVDVPILDCGDAKTALGNIVVSITVPVTVSQTLSTPQICWVGVFHYLGFGDEVGDLITCGHQTFDESCNIGFSFDLLCGDYAVIIGITPNTGQECYLMGATTKLGPIRMLRINQRMSVEVQYDCMQGYDIRYSYALVDRLNQAFGQAGMTDITVTSDQVNLPAKIFPNIDTLNAWINSNWWAAYSMHQTTAVLYLAGTKDAFPRVNFYGNRDLEPNAAAVSFAPPGGSIGDPGGYCVVFKDYLNYTFFTDDVEEAVLRTGTHEMGHMRADLTDAYKDTTGHQEGFQCVMDALKTDASGDLVTGYQGFCAYCISRIVSVAW